MAGCVPQGDRRAKELAGLSLLGVSQIDRVVEAAEATLAGQQMVLLGRNRLPALDLPKVCGCVWGGQHMLARLSQCESQQQQHQQQSHQHTNRLNVHGVAGQQVSCIRMQCRPDHTHTLLPCSHLAHDRPWPLCHAGAAQRTCGDRAAVNGLPGCLHVLQDQTRARPAGQLPA